ncbi:hypothetical protein FM107_16195 [Sphingobacterium sp. JB170]|nr:hypothetical protein FM107_16195 [Sphingobacterium sp. JB170]
MRILFLPKQIPLRAGSSAVYAHKIIGYGVPQLMYCNKSRSVI